MTSSRRRFLVACSSGILSAATFRKNAGAAPPAGFARYDGQARALLAQMTLEEKIGQMTQPDKNYIEHPEDVDNYHLGSVLSGGDSDPKTGNDLLSWTDMVDGSVRRRRSART
jgi:beta-glucosidase